MRPTARHPIRAIRRYGLKARELYTRRRSGGSASRVELSTFRDVLADYDGPTVFVHVGLSDVNSAFGGRSYELLYDELHRQFDSVLAPGFTFSFRDSGVFHKQFSRPEVGAFPRLLAGDADYRTEDPIHSILVSGDYRFDDCDHRDTFAPDGCWGKLDRDNVLVANIGTDRLVSTQFHYVSLNAEPPYHTRETHEGVVYFDERRYAEVEQVNDAFTGICNWNRWKMEDYLDRVGALERRDTNGLKLSFFRAGDMRRALAPRIEDDPYYMVT